MKLFFLIFLYSLIWKQAISEKNMDITINCFLESKIIQKKQVDDFKKYLFESNDLSSSKYITALLNVEYIKFFGAPYPKFGKAIEFAEPIPNHPKQIKVNLELTKKLESIYHCNVVSDEDYQFFITKIETNNFTHYLQLLEYMSDRLSFKEKMNKENLLIFIEKLHEKDIVKLKYDSLTEAVKEDKIRLPIDLLKYFDKSKIFCDLVIPLDPKPFLERIYVESAALAGIEPITNYSYSIELDTSFFDEDYKCHELVVSFSYNGKNYKQKSFYSSVYKGKSENLPPKISSSEYYHVFNEILKEKNSPYRIHEVSSFFGKEKISECFGLIVLTKSQYQFLSQPNSILKVSIENYD